MALAFENIGGGIVRRRFSSAGRVYPVGQMMSAEEIRAIKPRNLSSMIDNRYIEVWPAAPDQEHLERHVVHIGRGLYDVFEGRKLNAEPVSREEAEAIATQPEKGS